MVGAGAQGAWRWAGNGPVTLNPTMIPRVTGQAGTLAPQASEETVPGRGAPGPTADAGGFGQASRTLVLQRAQRARELGATLVRRLEVILNFLIFSSRPLFVGRTELGGLFPFIAPKPSLSLWRKTCDLHPECGLTSTPHSFRECTWKFCDQNGLEHSGTWVLVVNLSQDW